jgi:hypothetical protein
MQRSSNDHSIPRNGFTPFKSVLLLKKNKNISVLAWSKKSEERKVRVRRMGRKMKTITGGGQR